MLNIILTRCWRLCGADGRCTSPAVALPVCHVELTPLVHYVCTHTRTLTSDIHLRTVRRGIALMLARAGDFSMLKAEMRAPERIWSIFDRWTCSSCLLLCKILVVALSASESRGQPMTADWSGVGYLGSGLERDGPQRKLILIKPVDAFACFLRRLRSSMGSGSRTKRRGAGGHNQLAGLWPAVRAWQAVMDTDTFSTAVFYLMKRPIEARLAPN